jgi:4-aminobutyrate aminotransferase-like enzyme
LAVVAEPLFWNTGRLTPRQVLSELRALCTKHKVPLAIVENTTGLYRNGLATWLSDAWEIAPDAVFYYPSGQLGLTFLSDDTYVPDKLTLISTWDGDEVSLTRLLWELRVVSGLDLESAASRLAEAIRPLGKLDGLGLFRTVARPDARALRDKLREAGFDVGITSDGSLRFVPGLNVSVEELGRLGETIHGVI